MEDIANYFTNMPKSHRSMLLIFGLAFFFLIETIIPLFSLKYNKWKHAGINLFFTATTVIINLLMAGILIGAANCVEVYQLGLINWLSIDSLIPQVIIGLLLMDFIAAWLVHFIEHQVRPLWQFHVVHHTDQHVDTTTANRHHPGESIIRFVFTALAVLIIGTPIWLIFLYQSLSLIFTQFNHANIKMPSRLDNILVLVFCTPNMHRVHHHYRQPYSDCNYGNIFSFWDRIFKTYIRVDNSKLVYGVDTYMNKNNSENIIQILQIPFSGYRPPLPYEEEEIL